MPTSDTRWAAWLALSGATGLAYEVVWLRRLGLVLGGSAAASAFTVGAFMAGLGLGAVLATWASRSSIKTQHLYALLEAAAALWALCFPLASALLTYVAWAFPELRWVVAGAVLLPPATALGATWPVLSAHFDGRTAGRLYAANTGGAVVGVLATTMWLLPWLGVRGTEVAAACVGLLVAGAGALTPLPKRPPDTTGPMEQLPAPLLLAAGASGFAALGLEMVWMRLAAVSFGSTVQTIGGVLACFLAAMAVGAEVGRRLPGDPARRLGQAMVATAGLALAGAFTWGQLPYLMAGAFQLGGAELMWPASLALAVLTMAGAPAASGAAFTLAVRCLGEHPLRAAGPLVAANTLGAIIGAWAGGLWVIPALHLRGAVWLFAGAAGLAGAAWLRRPAPVLGLLLLAAAVPPWDAKLYAVGVHLRISDFADPSAQAVERFAQEGWELLYYDQGATGAVAVGRSEQTGNVWLSLNGKVDASTGDDMPTQELSGVLPVRIARSPEHTLLVGLASGVTAGAMLAERGVGSLTVLELEPSVVPASHYFDHVNRRPLDDPRTTLLLDDARAFLARTPERFDVIVSEPSNPWISGVSNLFTKEYWDLARSRLTDDGVFCQWVQLYGMGPQQLRALVRTFDHVFEDVWLFETIPGADVVLVAVPAGQPLPANLPLQPTLNPSQVACLGGDGWLNTDDRPRIEWEAPAYLHYDTAADNQALISQPCSRR